MSHCAKSWTGLALLAALAATAGANAAENARATRTETAATLANAAIELRFSLAAGQGRLVCIANKLAGRSIDVTADDFAVGLEGRGPLRAADFDFKEAADEAIPGGRRLVLRHEGKTPGTALDVIYELGDADPFARRRLELTTDKPLELRKVDAWIAGVAGTCSHQGFGEPVLLDDTFWGLEFPAAHNHYADGRVRLAQHPGRTVQGKWTSKSSVVGVAEKDRVVPRFRRYVETFQATPKDRNLFVNYNTWWTLMPPDEKNCLALIEVFRKKLHEPHGESFDTFTIDDGWDDKDSLWKVREDRFPRGFAPLVEELRKMNAHLGLWLSPSSGYSHAPWGAKAGYEQNSNPWYLCQSGPKYRRDIVPVVTGLGRKYDMAFFKFDGFSATCDAPGHGHLPGEYAKEANVEAYIELLEEVRKVRPDVFLDPTCGMWLSPWWLRWADAIWGSVSGDYPDIVVPAPVVRDSATTTRDAVFRQRCREHPGYPPAAIEHLGIIVITPEKWEDNAMIVLGRGCRLLTLYINPEFFTKPDADWAFLASILKWVRHNAATLAETELVLGDPMKREPYGYAHFAADRGIIALRNPFIEPRKVTVRLDETSGWEKPEAKGGGGQAQHYAARIVYPREEVLPGLLRHGASLELELSAYETVVVQLEPAGGDAPVLAGLRHREVRREGAKVEYEVFGSPGEKIDLPLPAPVKSVLLDGKPAPLTRNAGASTRLEFPGTPGACAVEDAVQSVGETQKTWAIQSSCTARVPPGTKAAMHVLCDPKGTYRGKFDCSAKVGGKEAPVRAVRSPEKPAQAHGKHSWTWFEFDLPEGESRVEFRIAPADGSGPFLRGEVGWWLVAEETLVKRTLTLESDKPLPAVAAEPRPLPLLMDRKRQVVTVRPVSYLRAGSRWPAGAGAVVRLDQVAPDECEQGWGTLQRNQSVWEKPMTIAGKKFDRGLGTHAEGRILYDLVGGGFKTFRARVGRDEHAMDGAVVFQVWVDGKKRFDSGPMQKTTPAREVEVEVSGAKLLELRTLPGDDGIAGDHGNWAEAELAR